MFSTITIRDISENPSIAFREPYDRTTDLVNELDIKNEIKYDLDDYLIALKRAHEALERVEEHVSAYSKNRESDIEKASIINESFGYFCMGFEDVNFWFEKLKSTTKEENISDVLRSDIHEDLVEPNQRAIMLVKSATDQMYLQLTVRYDFIKTKIKGFEDPSNFDFPRIHNMFVMEPEPPDASYQ